MIHFIHTCCARIKTNMVAYFEIQMYTMTGSNFELVPEVWTVNICNNKLQSTR